MGNRQKGRSVDKAFYDSTQWKSVRNAYISTHPLCEECLKRGLYNPAEHVHHKVWLNKTNVNNPDISLNPSNLISVCIECHNKIHSGTINKQLRYKALPNGEIISIGE